MKIIKDTLDEVLIQIIKKKKQTYGSALHVICLILKNWTIGVDISCCNALTW